MKQITATLIVRLFFAAIIFCFSAALVMFFFSDKVRDYREAVAFVVFGLLALALVLALIKSVVSDMKQYKKRFGSIG